MWHQLLDNNLDSNVPLEIPGWQIVASNTFSIFSKKPLPKQRNGYGYGLFSVMPFYHIATTATVDFYPGDMDSIRKWSMTILLNISQRNCRTLTSKETETNIGYPRKIDLIKTF